jgi:hypothetical protein
VAALFALFMFDEFDTGAFNVLAPDIQRDFDLSDQGFGTIVILNVIDRAPAGHPGGYLGDRYKRLPDRRGGRLPGRACLLSCSRRRRHRRAAGVRPAAATASGRLVNDPIHTSLLADYYPPAHDRWCSPCTATRPTSGRDPRQPCLAGGIVGVAARLAVAFMILRVPIAIAAYVAFSLARAEARRERRRRRTPPRRRRSAAVGFAEARRSAVHRQDPQALLRLERLLRRRDSSRWRGLPAAVLRGGVRASGPASRGVIVALGNAATLIGLLVGGALLPKWLARDPGLALKRGRTPVASSASSASPSRRRRT